MVVKFIHTRAFQISILVLALFSILCTRIPLFNYLGFEFSVLTVLITGYIGGILTLTFLRQTSFTCKKNVWSLFGEALCVQLILLLVPFLISMANGIFVKNCSVEDGAVLYAMIVLPGGIFSVSLAVFVRVFFKRWRKTIYTICYLLVLVHIPLVTFFSPQIFAFNPIIGFFPGFTYDETLQVTQRLLTYRLATFAASGVILAASIWIWQVRANKRGQAMEPHPSMPLLEIALLAFLGPIVLIMLSFSDRLGLSSSEKFIRQKLAGSYSTTHFEIIYPAGSVTRERIERIGRLHEFYFDRLTREMEIHFHKRILSFIYSLPEHKGRFIGAANTNICKPWLHQMHINIADIESVLKHEMVHILAGEFGWSPLRVAPNPGLIEGLAVAVEGVSHEEPLDRAAALAFAAGVRPDIKSLFSFSGFSRENAGLSYTLAGSFCRFLIDSMGMDKFKSLYASADFEGVYGCSLNSLLADWQEVVCRQPITASDSLKALYFFTRPSIVEKECVRVIANMNSATRKYIARHEYEQALVSAERSIALSRTPEALFQKTTALIEMYRFKDVVDFVSIIIQDAALKYTMLPIHIRLGDAYWALDSLAQAKREYEYLLNSHLGIWYEEALLLRLQALMSDLERDELKRFLLYRTEDTVQIEGLSKLSTPLVQYLYARELVVSEKYVEARNIFEQIGPFNSKKLEFFRLQRLGKVYFSLQEWGRAKKVFENAFPFSYTAFSEIRTKEWIDRCEFEMK